ncbi:PKD domain-containing protein, partial [Crocinitomix catalasitica]|nr:PKD domain-containing protein [Crocinitomix catalasitica]
NLLINNYPLATAASGPPIADLATFQCEDVVADITGGTDTMFVTTCQDSVTITFPNFTTGTTNVMQWDFDDGTFSSVFSPTHTFASDSIYEIEFFSTRFTCETCHLSDINYDTLVLVILPDSLDPTTVGTDPGCSGATDGTGEVTAVTGGSGPYTYSWSSGGTGSIETGLGGGTTYVTITGAGGCTAIDSVVLINPNPVDITLTTVDPSCNGFTDGSATITPTIPGSPYNYSWSSGGITATETGLIDGAYVIVVTDPSGCDSTIAFTLTEPMAVTVAPSIDTLICQNGTANLTAIGAGGDGGPYTYTWTGIGVGPISVSPTVNTCYDVIATDASGCVSPTENHCVNVRAPLTLAVSGADICPQSTADLSSVFGGGDGAYTFSWDVSGTVVGTTSNLSLPQSVTTTYCLTLDDGCETTPVTACITIDNLPEPAASILPVQICAGEVVNFGNPVVDPSGILTYDWDFGDGSGSIVAAPSHTYENEGIYDVTLTLITTENCTYQVDFNALVTVDAVPVATFSYNPQVVTVEDTEVEFTNNSIDATSFVWDFGDQTPNSSEINPSHVYPEVGDVTYTVTLWAYNGVCSDSYQQIINVQDIILFYVPNVFTPDGDSYNDIFKPIMTSGYDVYDYHLSIFNRWGELLFESYNAEYGWDGTYGSQGLSQDGVYVWQIEFAETMSD